MKIYATPRINFMPFILSLLALYMAVGTKGQPSPTAVTLRVGDKAPPLNAVWLKGAAPAAFGDGKVHVVEFWATWCGACRMNMPHLSSLAQRYKGQVSVTSLNVWELAYQRDKSLDYMKRVKAFVDSSHDMMDYTVGADNREETIGHTWLRAAGVIGIPSAFVIDQEGRIAWIGGPLSGLEDIVPLVIARKLDAKAIAKVRADSKARLAEHVKFQKESEEAMKAGDYLKALVAAEAAIKADPLLDDYVIFLKYEALDRIDRARSRAFAREVMKTHNNAPILLINMWASKLLNDSYKNADYQIALELMQVGMRCVDANDVNQASLLAKAYFKTGNVKKAIEIQKILLQSMEDPVKETPAESKEKERRILEEYKAQLALRSSARSFN